VDEYKSEVSLLSRTKISHGD